MNPKTILQEINNISNSIDKLAWNFLRKIKRPSLYTIEDLREEAICVIINVLQSGKYFDPERKVKLSTYLLQCVKSRFCDILWKSYRGIDFANLVNTSFVKSGRFPSKTRGYEILEIFSEDEIKYITLFLFPPKEIERKHSNLSKGKLRKIAKERLEISWKREDYLRKSIENKLTKLIKERWADERFTP